MNMSEFSAVYYPLIKIYRKNMNMNLDCYLEATRYISELSPSHKELDSAINSDVVKQLIPDGTRIDRISMDVINWENVPAIHNWFVNHVQNGNDDDREYDVSKEQLMTLYVTCLAVLNDFSTAEDMLPIGLLYSSERYGQKYFDGLQKTVDGLKPLMFDPKWGSWHFTYKSMWVLY